MFLKELVLQKLKEEKMSIRSAARVMGISHTTLANYVNGIEVDLPTIKIFCKWLNVPVRDALGLDYDSDLASAVASVIKMEPALEKVFREAAEGVKNGEITVDDLTDIVRYAAFRIQMRKENNLELKRNANSLPEDLLEA